MCIYVFRYAFQIVYYTKERGERFSHHNKLQKKRQYSLYHGAIFQPPCPNNFDEDNEEELLNKTKKSSVKKKQTQKTKSTSNNNNQQEKLSMKEFCEQHDPKSIEVRCECNYRGML